MTVDSITIVVSTVQLSQIELGLPYPAPSAVFWIVSYIYWIYLHNNTDNIFLSKSHGNKNVKSSKEPFPFCILLLKTRDLFGRYVRGMGIEFVIINCELAGEFLN